MKEFDAALVYWYVTIGLEHQTMHVCIRYIYNSKL
jgi:hypothetical protein